MALTRRYFIKGGLAVVGTLSWGPDISQAVENMPLFPPHPPMGEGTGLNPGRVVWIHRPGVVNWDGMDYWWKPENYDQAKILEMTRTGIAKLADKSSPQEAWQVLFDWQSRKNGKPGGYRPGQKIAIKVNMNGAGEYNDDPHGQLAAPYGNSVLLKALLQSLVSDGGVRPDDITVYDVCRIFPDYMRAMCTENDLAGVRFRHRDNGGPLEAKADFSAPVQWSGKVEGETTYLPECVTEADYLINLANLKGHSWGLTLAGKNHFGSFVNGDSRRPPAAAGLHPDIIDSKMGDYSAIADLLAHRQLGGKTMLYMLDGLVTAPSETGNISPENSRWQMEPFNGDFAASLFFSQDPVALDSVGADFLTHEPVMRRHNSNLAQKRSMENYLHEAAQLGNPPSGTAYTDGNGGNPGSLGVHEHWNNAREKLYSRNLGKPEGIELIRG